MKVTVALLWFAFFSCCYGYNILLYCTPTTTAGVSGFRCDQWDGALSVLGHNVVTIRDNIGLTDADFDGIDVYFDVTVRFYTDDCDDSYSPATIEAIQNYLDASGPAYIQVEPFFYGGCNDIKLDNFINPYIFGDPISLAEVVNQFSGLPYFVDYTDLPLDKSCVLETPTFISGNSFGGVRVEEIDGLYADSILVESYFNPESADVPTAGIWSTSDAITRLIVETNSFLGFYLSNTNFLLELDNLVEYLAVGCDPCRGACDPNPFTCSPEVCVDVGGGNFQCVVQDACPDDGDPCTVNTCEFGACSVRDFCPPPLNECQYYECTLDYFGNAQCDVDRVECDDGNACTNDYCDALLGCQFEEITCSRTSACFPVSCDPSIGCVEGDEIECDDGNLCTIDYCDSERGCQITFENCDDGDACTNDSCDESTGNCINEAIICPSDQVCDKFGECKLPNDFGIQY